MKRFVMKRCLVTIVLNAAIFLMSAAVEDMDAFHNTYYSTRGYYTNVVGCYKMFEKRKLNPETIENRHTYLLADNLVLVDTTVIFFNCTLKPGVFESTDFLATSSSSSRTFISEARNYNPILRNHTFHGLCQLEYIKLADNHIRNIESNAFSCTRHVVKLDLSANQLETLPGKVFKAFDKLSWLNLSKNSMQSLTKDTFNGLENLSELILSENNLHQLTMEVFDHLRNLIKLRLNNNPLLVLEKHCLSLLKKLEFLDLAGCNLTILDRSICILHGKLKEIILERNQVQAVDSQECGEFITLQALFLGSNNISDLTNLFLNEFSELLRLSLSKNKLSRIKRTNLIKLKKLLFLDLSENVIEIIERNSFDHMQNLQYIALLKNHIKTLFGFNLFQYNKHLKEIDVSFNKLTYVNVTELQQVSILEALKLTNNEVEYLTVRRISKSFNIHIEYNKLRYIYVSFQKSTDTSSTEKLKLYVSGNPFDCNCNNYDIYNVIKDGYENPWIEIVDEVVCWNPENQRGKKLRDISASDFQCVSCPERCVCEYDVHDDRYMEIDCSAKSYDFFPSVTHSSTSKLNISNNNIKSLKYLRQTCWKSLVELHAENNQITSEEMFVPEKLLFLDLRDNGMRTLPKAIQQHIQNVNDFEITLANNPWPCDCSILDLKLFLINNRAKVVDVEEIRCISPNKSVSSKILIMMYDDELCPPFPFMYGYVICALLLLIAFTLIFYYKYQLLLLSFVYTHCSCCYFSVCCGHRDEGNKEFDCFISYSSKDSEVALSIIQELENKPPHYSFCIHERNWIAGEYITKNILMSVQNSRKTLIVLSEDFMKSSWFHLEFQAAYRQTLQDKRNRLLIVLKGELPDKRQLDKDVQAVLAVKNYLRWGDRWFWEKLRYALRREVSFAGILGRCGSSCVNNFFRRDDNRDHRTNDQ